MPDRSNSSTDAAIVVHERGRPAAEVVGTPASLWRDGSNVAIALSRGDAIPSGRELFDRILAGEARHSGESPWAGVAFDARLRTLHCLRDPIGEVPLAFIATGGRAAAGWSASLVAEQCGIALLPNALRIAAFCSGRADSNTADFLDDVQRVLPGQHVEVTPADVRRRLVFGAHDPRTPTSFQPTVDEAVEELDRHLNRIFDSVDRCTVALSGGVDSALLATYLRDRVSSAIHLTSSTLPGVDERAEAKQVAEAFGFSLEIVEIDSIDLFTSFDPSEPQLFPVSALDQRLRAVAPDLLLTGLGSDQLFGANQNLSVRSMVSAGRWRELLEHRTTDRAALTGAARGTIERSPLGRSLADLADDLRRKQPSDIEKREPWMKASAWIAAPHQSAGDLLHSWAWEEVVRNSWACGTRVIHPYLDPELWSFAARLPNHMRWRHGQDKFLVRELLRRRAPELTSVANRQKSQSFNAYAVQGLMTADDFFDVHVPDLARLGVARPQSFANRFHAFQRAAKRDDARWEKFHTIALWRTIAAQRWTNELRRR